MIGRARDVDLGPLVLPVGVDPGPAVTPVAPVAAAADVFRFAELMRRAEEGRGDGEAEALVAEAFSPDRIGGEVERIWAACVGRGRREVRIALRHDVLPRTQVRVAETAGCLDVEFTVAHPQAARWLAGRASALAADLCARLRRDVLVSVRETELAPLLASERGSFGRA